MSCGTCRLCFGTKPPYQPILKEVKMSETSFATALDSLGEILLADPGRDAVHLATYAVVAGERLFPGQHIGITSGNIASASAPKLLGIVDPFLQATVYPSQMFWMLLYPRTITSLRHVWTHPAFETEVTNLVIDEAPSTPIFDIEIAKANVRKIASDAGTDYEHIMSAITGSRMLENNDGYTLGGSNDGEYLTIYGDDAYGEIPDTLWQDIEIITGKPIPVHERPTYFSCSC